MSKLTLPLAIVTSLTLALPVFALPVTVKGGQWEGFIKMETEVFVDQQDISDCIDGQTEDLTLADLLRKVEPDGQCTVLSEETAGSVTTARIKCTGGMVTEGTVVITPTAEQINIDADVVFEVDDGDLKPGTLKIETRRTGICTDS